MNKCPVGIRWPCMERFLKRALQPNDHGLLRILKTFPYPVKMTFGGIVLSAWRRNVCWLCFSLFPVPLWKLISVLIRFLGLIWDWQSQALCLNNQEQFSLHNKLVLQHVSASVFKSWGQALKTVSLRPLDAEEQV